MKYFSIFSGIGGFEYGIQKILPSTECVGYSEVDKYAKQIYERHYPNHINYGDATTIPTEDLPEFDLLVGGFPCQAFSVAGKGRGFCDTRGTLFFEIARVLQDKRPRYFLLENVKGLLFNNQGKTFQEILKILTQMGYFVEWQVLNSKDFGVPQNRERVFLVGHLGGNCRREIFPLRGDDQKIDQKHEMKLDEVTHGVSDAMRIYNVGKINNGISGQVDNPLGIARTLKGLGGGLGAKTGLYVVPSVKKIGNIYDSGGENRDVLEPSGISKTLKSGVTNNPKHEGIGSCNSPKIAIPVLTPDRAKKRQNGRRFKTDGEPAFILTQQDKHGVYDGFRIRRLTPLECERLQGFPDNWTKYGVDGNQISDTQRYKCLGNAVTTNVISEVMNRLC